MNPTFQEQLANLPIPSLTTVLRLSLPLQEDPFAHEKASGIVVGWWNEKAAPYDISIQSDTDDLSFSRAGFKIEFARAGGSLALSMEEPDSSTEGRCWIVDIGLRTEGRVSEFSLRASYRQPYSSQGRPEPRAPRFLREILAEVGAMDVWPVLANPSEVDADSLPYFIELLESDQRSLPVVVVSEEVETGHVFTDLEKLARFLAGAAHVVRLNSEASWDLSKQFGKDWSVFQGAVRCYSPKLEPDGDKFRHRLWLPASIARLDADSRNGFLNTVVQHIFTEITAEFESRPILTPSSIRRQVRDTAKTPSEQPVEFRLTAETHPEQIPLRLEVRVADTEPQPASIALDTVLQVLELEAKLAELAGTIHRLEEINEKQERDLEQEKAGRAETEKSLRDAIELQQMWEEENSALKRRESLAKGDVSKEPSEALRPVWQSFSGLFNAVQTMAIHLRRVEQDSDNLYAIEQELVEAKRVISNQKATLDSLNRRDLAKGVTGYEAEFVNRDELVRIVPRLARKQVGLSTILEAVCIMFPDRITVLQSATDSAAQAGSFQHCEQAFDLLLKLATEYWESIQASGDVEGRKLFGKSYAAKEKSALSKDGRARRTFQYNGESVVMEKHLKIGTADNPSDTLRVHFEWFADEKRIVIGHCGRHLDF